MLAPTPIAKKVLCDQQNREEDLSSTLLRRIGEWVFVERRVVSVKSLSRQQGISPSQAKEVLAAFSREKAGRADLEVITLVSGTDAHGLRKVRLVRRRQDAGLARVTSRHVYAVAPLGLRHDRMTASVLSAARKWPRRERRNSGAVGVDVDSRKGKKKKREEGNDDDDDRKKKRRRTAKGPEGKRLKVETGVPAEPTTKVWGQVGDLTYTM